MDFFFKGTLRKAFLAAAVFTTFTGIVPSPMVQPAEASVVVSSAAASAAAAAAAAANARHNREAQDAVIVNPTDQNISALADRGLVDNTTIPYIRQTVAEMKVAPGTDPDNITDNQRDQFMARLENKRLVAEMSAATPADAVAKGMSQSLSPYFAATKTELGYSGAVTLPEAQSINARLEDKHWQNDTKPALEKAGMIGGGLVVVGGVAYAIAKRRRDGIDDF